MDEWHVGDPADWGDSIGVPDIPYMGYLNDDEDEDEKPPKNKKRDFDRAKELSDEAWRLDDEGRYEEALELINRAIELFPSKPNHHNRKAIILEDLGRYDEALRAYDRALAISENSTVIANNKAGCMLDMLERKQSKGFTREDLDFINEALKVLPKEKDNCRYLSMKGDILISLGEPVKGKMCYFLSNKLYDEVEKAESQLKSLKNSYATFIRIAGTQFYQGLRPFHDGAIMDLIKEPENSHDRNAIRCEINGKTVGYVANSQATLIKEVKSATEIKNTPKTKAEFQFVLLDEYVIAKLI